MQKNFALKQRRKTRLPLRFARGAMFVFFILDSIEEHNVGITSAQCAPYKRSVAFTRNGNPSGHTLLPVATGDRP